MALTFQGASLAWHAAAEAFPMSRPAGDSGHIYGTRPSGADVAAIIDRPRAGHE